MTNVMHEHHILLLPTVHQEPFARVVLEGMASGLAVIAADVGGTSEIVQHGVSGLLCQPGDADGMSRCIQMLIKDVDLRAKLAKEGQRRVIESFSLEHMVDTLELFLSRAVAEDN